MRSSPFRNPVHEAAEAPHRPPFPAEPRTRDIARALHATVRDLPIVSPHGHTDPRWFAYDDPFPTPSELLIVPEHYVFRMLMSQGVKREELGVPTRDGCTTATEPRAISNGTQEERQEGKQREKKSRQ